MSSITGGFRWGLLGRFSLIALPLFLLSTGVDMALGGVPEFRWNADSVFLIFVVLLTTPFQSAGEEYGVRGVVARSVGSWFGSRRLGLVVAAVTSSLLFMVLHSADNLWLNIYYFSVGMICSVLAWRTGGLEAPVALHICNNLVSEITLPFGGLDGLFDRGPTSVGPEILFQLVFTLAVMGGMLWIARKRALPLTAAPAAPVVETLSGTGEVWWNSSHHNA
jgi:membrane protease YdiL (CAAX protease family)